MDRDGDQDFIAAQQPAVVYENLEGNQFNISAEYGGGDALSLTATDFNDNGYKDLVVGYKQSTIDCFKNDGGGSFTHVANYGEQYDETRDIESADFNQDGKQDFVVANESALNTIYLNEGGGSFTESTKLGSRGTRSVAIGDFNGDGYPDVVFGRDYGRSPGIQVYYNNQDDTFSKEVTFGDGGVMALAVADWDGDGDQDILAGRGVLDYPNYFYFQKDDGTFNRVSVPGGEEADTMDIETVDVDQDGDLDFLTGNNGASNNVFRNQGDGEFSQVASCGGGRNTFAVAVADLVNLAPEADAGGPYSGLKNEPVQLNGSDSTDFEGKINTYNWDLDDNGEYDDGSGIEQSHSWDSVGKYTVGLKVVTENGAESTATAEVEVISNTPPDADFSYKPSTVRAAERVEFTSESSDDGSITSYLWDFGDGTTATGPKPNHTYDDEGNYQVSLRVEDEQGAEDSVEKTLQVNQNTPPDSDVKVTFRQPEYYCGQLRGISIGYTRVTQTGSTTITQYTHPPVEKPSGIHFLGCYYGVETTANFTGEVSVDINYDDTNLDSGQEQRLTEYRLMSGEDFSDITGSLNSIEDEISGSADKLSYFSVGFGTGTVASEEIINHGPSPVPSEGVVFWLDLPADTESARLRIYDIDGKPLNDLSLGGNLERFPQIGRWQPRDANDNKLSRGIYLYKLYCKTESGRAVLTEPKRMVIKR